MTRSPAIQPTGSPPSPLAQAVKSIGPFVFVVLTSCAAIIALSFLRNARLSWIEMNAALVAMVVLLATAHFWHAAITRSVGDAALLLLVACAVSVAFENLGLRSALFGTRYSYHPDLTPRLPGGVPLVIPLMWFVLASVPLVLLRRSPLGLFGGEGGASTSAIAQSVFGGLWVMAADLFLDPLGTTTAAWRWSERGMYFGTPLRNYAGWFTVATLTYLTFFVLRGMIPARPRPLAGSVAATPLCSSVLAFDTLFVVAWLALTLVCIVASVVFLSSLMPIVLALLVMAPCWLVWAASQRRRSA